MSFQARQTVRPLDPPPQYRTTTNTLGGYGLSAPRMPQTVTSYFGNDRALPMYKDKPYFAPRRTVPRRRWKLILNVLGVCTLIYLWYYKGSLLSWNTTAPYDAQDKGLELWKWVQSLDDTGASKGSVDWDERREKVRDAFVVSWEDYEKNGWGYDEYGPMTNKRRNMVEGGMGWIIVDALDTMILMNLTKPVQHAREWIHTSLQYNQDHDVNTFETTIRMLGGLLSAHYLSIKHPELAQITDDDVGAPGEDLYIEKATDLADRILGAFDTRSGIPLASVNLNKSEGIPAHNSGGASSTAEATTVQLEFKYMAKLTGESEYWTVVEKVMEVMDDLQPQDGLVPIFINPDSGKFKGNEIRLGSRGDSYYEYLIKQYLQTSEQEPVYKEMWDESLQGIRKHLLAFTQKARLMMVAELPSGIGGNLHPKMDHLVCFLPGTIALGATGGQPLSEARKSSSWTQQNEDEILISRELMKTCWATYLATETGLAGEITYFKLDKEPVMMADKYPLAPSNAGSTPKELQSISGPLTRSDSDPWRSDLSIHTADRHNLQRPETVESLFYMYRVTGDEIYREWGWEMFVAFVRHTAVLEEVYDEEGQAQKRIKGFTSLSNADTIPPVTRDNMESFWMAETLKYLYLLFSDRDFISLEEHVFNTEAHPFPRFKPAGDLKTGWTRKPRSAPDSGSGPESL
ncbi:uncharacterized protein PFLUO_LOCUS1902 [Penicillium psychrofluorescens]|uniref:uncharacterized protein n=1 Tax=Penicillium psychrofluorescens TaxID=3158075 RepID=UPI003CCD4398